MRKSVSRAEAAWTRIGVKRSMFYKEYVPLLRPVKLGRRAVGYLDDEIDALIDSLTAERDQPKFKKRVRVVS